MYITIQQLQDENKLMLAKQSGLTLSVLLILVYKQYEFLVVTMLIMHEY